MLSIKIIEFKMLVKEQLRVEVFRNQYRRAKYKVYDLLISDNKANYAMMWDYCDELRRSNRGSSIYMKVERPIPNQSSVFDRFYVCFDAMRTSLLNVVDQ